MQHGYRDSEYVVVPTRSNNHDITPSATVKPKMKRIAPVPSRRGASSDPRGTSANFRSKTARPLGQREQLEEQVATLSQAALKDLRTANKKLAAELQQEKTEHDQDIMDARASVQDLQAALSASQARLDSLERRLAEETSSSSERIQSLQAQLQEERTQRATAEREAAANAGTCQAASEKLIAAITQLDRRTVDFCDLRERHGGVSAELSTSKEALTEARTRVEAAASKLEQQQQDLGNTRRRVEYFEDKCTALSNTVNALESEVSSLRQEGAQGAGARKALEAEVARTSQALTIERELHTQAKQDLQQVRAENKDLMQQRTRDTSLLTSAEDTRKKWDSAQEALRPFWQEGSHLRAHSEQLERTALESALMACNVELAQLKADNRRLANDWHTREASLTSSHELRVGTLLTDITSKDKHNGELHMALHRANTELQAATSQLQSSQQELRAFKDKNHSLETQVASAREDILALRQAVRQREQELTDAQQVHSQRVDIARSDLQQEQRAQADLQRRLDVASSQLEGREATIAAMIEGHEREITQRDDKVHDMAASLRALGEKVTLMQSAHGAEAARSDSEIGALRDQVLALTRDNAGLKASLERSAAAQESVGVEREQLRAALAGKERDLREVQDRLADERATCNKATAEMVTLKKQHAEELDTKARMTQDVLAAMQAEEQSKLAALQQVRTQKEAHSRLQEENLLTGQKLEETLERCRDAEYERDDAVASLERARRRTQTLQSENRRSHAGSDRQPHADAYPAPAPALAPPPLPYDYRGYSRSASTRDRPQRLESAHYDTDRRQDSDRRQDADRRQPLDPVPARLDLEKPEYKRLASRTGQRVEVSEVPQLQRELSRRRNTKEHDQDMAVYKQRLAEIRAQR